MSCPCQLGDCADKDSSSALQLELPVWTYRVIYPAIKCLLLLLCRPSHWPAPKLYLQPPASPTPSASRTFAVPPSPITPTHGACLSPAACLQYPVYATQWHPEKNAFEWASFLRIPHSPEGIEVTQEMANFFVSEARKSKHAAVCHITSS